MRLLLLLSLAALAPFAPAAVPLEPRAAELLAASLRFSDRLWDDRAALLWTATAEPGAARRHLVRETVWYAYGLQQRDQPGDRARSQRALEAILAQQIVAPGQEWDGTFFRAPEEPPPLPDAKPWDDYDPNWREFIGTTFALFLLDYPDRLPAELRARLEDSIRRAVEGELHSRRLVPSYTNIALMHGFLWTFAGRQLHRDDWVKQGEAWAEAIHAGFKEHDAFEEYNSPTYYGVDLFGLGLWRKHGPTDRLRALGVEMEAALWRDIAAFYHAGLKNLAGPFDRSYGMDLRRYVSLTGAWLALALPKELAPFPDPDGPMEHANDFVCVPTYVALGANLPSDALAHFQKFQGERQVTRPITGPRIATAWLGENLMLGGEFTALTRSAGTPHSQFHPATIHWRTPDGGIGWILLRQSPRTDARAEKNRLVIAAVGDATFRLDAPGLVPASITRDRWTLPGLTVEVTSDASDFRVIPADGGVDVSYREATKFVLRTSMP